MHAEVWHVLIRNESQEEHDGKASGSEVDGACADSEFFGEFLTAREFFELFLRVAGSIIDCLLELL